MPSNVYVKFESRIPLIVAVGNAGTAESVASAATAVWQGCVEKSRYDTGTMRNGWTVEQVASMTYRVFNPVSYTVFNELGTMYMSAQPMLIPTLEEVMPDYEADVKRSWYATGAGLRVTMGGRL